MAGNTESEKLTNGMSVIEEEDSDPPVHEDGEDEKQHLISDSAKKAAKLSPGESEHSPNDASDNGSLKSSLTPPLATPETDESKKEDDNLKTVKFADDIEVYDLSSKAATPITISLDTPVSQYNDQYDQPASVNSTTGDSAAILPLSEENSDSSSAPRPADLTLPESQDEPGDGDQSGHKQFEILNVEEPNLKDIDEPEDKEGGGDNKSNAEDKPVLQKMSSTVSDGYSAHSSLSTNQDTIGPLDNPGFLKRLQYSVSQAVEDDGGFGATDNLELGDFQGLPPAPDMDAGWAWVVLFAAFFSLSLTGATTFMAGVLMPAILEQIDPDIAKASWIGAVHVSVMCMSGPFVGIILTRLGARGTAFLAGLVLSGGMIGSYFGASIIHLIFTHGLISGIGSGFILNTMFVICGQYFNRYRGIACGLLATGSGAGMLAGGNVLTVLFNNFGLNGTYLLWGGITLHTVIFAMLLRPSPEERLREEEKKLARDPNFNKGVSQGDLRSGHNSMISGLNSVYSSGDGHSIFSGRTFSSRRLSRLPSRLSRGDIGVAPLLKTVLHKELSKSSFSVATTRSQRSQRSQRSHRKSQTNIPPSPSTAPSKFTFGPASNADGPGAVPTPSPGATPLSRSPQPSSPLAAQEQGDQSPSTEKPSTQIQDKKEPAPLNTTEPIQEEEDEEQDRPIPPSSPTSSRAPSEFSRSMRRRLLSGVSQVPSQYTSLGRLSYRPSIREQLTRNDLDNESLASTLVSHLQPKDALTPRYQLGSRSIPAMMGSIASFPTALAIVKDDLARIEGIADQEKKTLKDYLIGFLDSLRLLRNKPFFVFICTCLIWALGESPFTMYLPAYTISKGSTKLQASSLYTGMGFGSMCGRFLSGLVASDSGIGPVLLHIGCLSVAGLLVAVSPLLTETYFSQMIVSGFFGFYTGSLVPLSSLITIELLGIGELGLGFGFLSLFQGIGYLAGPPVGGMFVKAIGYEASFAMSGCVLISGSMLAMMIAILLKNASDEEDIHDSFDDLEKALRRISDTESEGSGSDEEPSHNDEESRLHRPFIIGSFHGSHHHGSSFHGSSLRKKEESAAGGGDASSPHEPEKTEEEEEQFPMELEPIEEEA